MIGGEAASGEIKRAYLIPDLPDEEILPAEYKGLMSRKLTRSNPLAFQYWPETLTDSKDSTREERRIPGLSGPMYYWTSGGPRTISLSASFSRDEDEEDDVLGLDVGVDIEDILHNVNIDAATKWLRSFQYPTYSNDFEQIIPPPNLWLVLPGTGLAWDGGDEMLCYMAACDVTIMSWFGSGHARLAEVALTFYEVLGSSWRDIVPHNRTALIERTNLVERYKLSKKDLGDYAMGIGSTAFER